MVNKIKLAIAAFVLLLISNVQAQVKSFNPDPNIFIEEFGTFIKGVNNASLNEEFKLFDDAWRQGKFSPIQKEKITKISNAMMLERLQANPYFELFMKGMIAFAKNNLPAKNLDQWHAITGDLLAKNKKSYLSFLEQSAQLFENKILYKTNNEKWVVEKLDFDLLNDSKEISIKFNTTNLRLIGINDSIEIKNTSGIYYPDKQKWIGKQGEISFDRTIKTDKAHVNFSNYSLKLSENTIIIDTVKLTRPKYFANPIEGKFIDKLNSSTDTSVLANKKYPQFFSFQNTLEIKNIVGKNATFVGGYSMVGKEIITKTANKALTTIHLYYNGKKYATIQSEEFKIDGGSARSNNASLVMYNDSGNIKHPGLNVLLNFEKNVFIATRNDIGLQRRPFQDDYHKMDIFVDQLIWEMDKPLVKLDNLNNDQPAFFESKAFFKDMLYERVKGALMTHPLEALNAFFYQPTGLNKKTTHFHINDFAAFMKTKTEYLRTPFIELHDKGYILYNPETDSVELSLKLFSAVQSHKKVRDYDVIRLSSTIASRPNAELNLLNYQIEVQGVQKFYFSDSQSVIAFPTEQIVKIRRNRTLDFGGMVAAGRFDFFGKQFKFNYDQFSMDYTRIDSMRMYYPESSGKGDVAIKSVLRNIYGTLLIDKPDNKSGLKNYPEYPIFRSSKGSEILYDKPNIHAGAYKSDKFKFEVDPFEIDSLDNFTIEGLQFDGTFISAGIFPEFRYKASIQPDYSLGFVKHTPAGGYPMYGGKGKGDMTMNLSEQGFYGENGTIVYETGEAKFEKILLLPDKTVGQVNSYTLAQSGKYPKVFADKPSIEWTPYDNKFKINQGETPIKVFKYEYDFNGTLTQSPSKLDGDGTLAWDQAVLSSKAMALTPNKADTRVGNLRIFTADSTKIAFETKNINGNFDFDKRYGKFGTNEKDAETQFPFNTFATNLNDFNWDMNKKTITAKIGPAMAGGTPLFKSTNVAQDSLMFEAKQGIYDLNDYTLTVEGIPYIDMADSRLYLKDGIAKIRENGNIDILNNTKLIANRKDKFHEIYDLNIKVYGKNKVFGKGKYVYTTKNGLKQEFNLDSVVVAEKRYVSATGYIDQKDSFTLDLKIGYKGFAKVKSTEQNIEFVGYVKPLHSFTNIIPSTWLKFNNFVDPKNVIIDVSDPRDKDNKKQYVGLFIANDSSHVYPLFFSWKRRYSDPDVSNDTGIFYYDQAKNSFFAGNKEKLLNGALKGNYMQLNEKDKSIHAEGLLDFGIESPIISFKSAGTADLAAGDSAFTFNMALMLDFPLPKEYNARLKQLLLGDGKGTINPNQDFFKDALGEMISDQKNATKILDNILYKGVLDGKDEAQYKLIFNNANFRWDSKLRGMWCSGDIELINYDGTPIHKSIHVDMLVEHKRSGENIHLYMKLPGGEDFYINLQKNFAYLFTSDTKLNEIFATSYDKIGTDQYFLRKATERQVIKFKDRLGVD